MATHDYVIANGTGASVRSDLNNALAAIVSNNSSATEPTSTFAFMWWADTTAGQLKLRNAADDGWVTIQELDGTMLMEDGTVGAPGLAFASDLDTGFYRGADNELGIATGGTNAVYIDDAQQVGIGTTTVNRPLAVYNDSVAALALQNSTTGTAGSDGFQIQLVSSDGYVFNYENAPIIFGTNSTERARIDSSGRLLVGTSSSPGAGDGQYSLQVIQGYVGVPTGQGLMSLQRGETASNITSNETIGVISFNDSDGYVFGQIYCQADANAGASDFPGRLVFSTTADSASSPTERMRINSNGIIQARNGAGDTLNLYNAVSAGTSSAFIYGVHSSTSAYTGTTSFIVYTNGNVVNTNGSYTTLSDVRLKENIVDAGPQWDDLKAIRIRNWNFKEETGYETHRQIGPIAQELEQVCPGLVFDTPDRDADGNKTGEVTKGINQSVLYMKAVKALQEAMERIEQLETSNADLLARVTALEAQ